MTVTSRNEPTVFQRTPIPSAPAKSSISKIQVALNNLIGQLCETVYFVTETAPPVTIIGGSADDEQFKLCDKEIQLRSAALCSVIKAIESMSDELPSSSFSQEHFRKQIVELQHENAIAETELRLLTAKADQLNLSIKAEIRRLAEEL